MKLINLTPHAINVRLDGRDIAIPPSGQVARVAASAELVAEVDGIPVYRTVFGAVEGLPRRTEGVLFVTSTLVAQAAARLGRTDVVSPDTGPTAIRENGQIVAVTRLQTFAQPGTDSPRPNEWACCWVTPEGMEVISRHMTREEAEAAMGWPTRHGHYEVRQRINGRWVEDTQLR